MSDQNGYTEFKAYEELEFRDDFMFGKVMEDKRLCREILECLLQQPVGELSNVDTQREYRNTEDGKSIRVDIYTQDDKMIYDAEMQNLGNKSIASLELPRRSRFYQSAIDTDYMRKGTPYRSLPDSSILFICTFDPFEKGLSQYTFYSQCREDDQLALQDGTVRIFYNCCYTGEAISDDLRNFYQYVETGACSDELTNRIDQAVRKARKMEEWRSDYMKERTLIMDAIFEERQRAESAEKRIKELEEQIASLGFIPHGLNVNENDTISTNPDVKEEVSTMPEMSQVIFNKGFSEGAEEKQSDAVRKLSEQKI